MHISQYVVRLKWWGCFVLFCALPPLSDAHSYLGLGFLPWLRCFETNRRLRGINREIGFGFVSCSCRACVRACVRSCVSVRGTMILYAGGNISRVVLLLLLRPGLQSGVFATIHKGFKEILCIWCYTQGFYGNFKDLLLYTRVLRKFFAFDAIRKGFKEIWRICYYTQGF